MEIIYHLMWADGLIKLNQKATTVAVSVWMTPGGTCQMCILTFSLLVRPKALQCRVPGVTRLWIQGPNPKQILPAARASWVGPGLSFEKSLWPCGQRASRSSDSGRYRSWCCWALLRLLPRFLGAQSPRDWSQVPALREFIVRRGYQTPGPSQARLRDSSPPKSDRWTHGGLDTGGNWLTAKSRRGMRSSPQLLCCEHARVYKAAWVHVWCACMAVLGDMTTGLEDTESTEILILAPALLSVFLNLWVPDEGQILSFL